MASSSSSTPTAPIASSDGLDGLNLKKCNWKCNWCALTTDSDKSLLQHILKKHRHWETTSLASHQKEEEEQTHWTCSVCSFDTNAKKELLRHVRRRHMTFRKCPLCNYIGANNKHDRHLLNVHGKMKKYKCRLCEYSARKHIDIVEHLNITHLVCQSKTTFEIIYESLS